MNNDNKEKTRYYAKLFGFRRAVPILLAAIGIFITVCFFTEGAGLLGGAVSSLLKGLFSVGAYLIPALLLLHAIFYAGDYVKGLLVSRTVFSVIAVFLVSSIEYIAVYWSEPVFEPTVCYVNQSAGGFLGSTVAFALTKALGPVGLIILSVTVIAIYITYFFATGNSVASKSVMKVFTSFKEFFTGISSRAKAKKEEKRAKKAELDRIESERRTGELLADNFFGIEEGTSELKIEQLGIDEKKPVEPSVDEGTEARPEQDVKPAEPEIKKADRPKRTLNLDYGLGLDGGSAKSESTDAAQSDFRAAASEGAKRSAQRASFGLDDNADSVFTKEFDPFDFATAERVIAKPSTRARVNGGGISEVTTPLSGITERDVEDLRAKQAEQRRRDEFAERKRKILENISSGKNAQQNNYTAPTAAAQQNNYTAPAAAAQQNNYTAPTTVAQQNNYTAPAAPAFEEKHKTVEFNVVKEEVTPSESGTVTFVFDKSEHYPDETQKIAAEVAQMLEKNVTGYTRSANRSFTYMKVTESGGSAAQSANAGATLTTQASPTENYAQGFGAPSAQSGMGGNSVGVANNATTNAPATSSVYGTSSAQGGMGGNSYEAPRSDFGSSFGRYNVNEANQASGGYADNNANAPSPTSEYPGNNASAPSYAGGVSVSEYSTLDGQRGESGSSSSEDLSRGDSASSSQAPSFTEYRTPDIQKADVIDESEENLKIERTLIEPAVDTSRDIFTERDKQYTMINADTESSYESESDDGEASVSDDDSDGTAAIFSEGTELSFGDTEQAEPAEESAKDIAEIFGDDSAEDEELPEEELTPEEDIGEVEEIPPEEQNPEILKQREMFAFLRNEPVEQSTEKQAATQESAPSATEEDVPPFDMPSPAESVPQSAAPSSALITEKEAKKSTSKAPSYKNFKFPSIDLLGLNDEMADDISSIERENDENAERLLDTLSSFNVTASIKGVDRGPRITRYEVVPAKGVKVSSIMNLQDDIALSLAADGIRMEAPIPGKSAVGVEIPNKHSTTVRLRELLESEEFKNEKSKTAICIGKDVAGQPVINDISKMPHLLIAGATGMGKSVCINSLLISILYKARPDEVKLIMIDPKQVEFTMYNGIPHLLIPVVSDAKQAAGALMWAVDEMEKRFTQLNSACVRNIDGYNEKVAEDPSIGEPMSKIIIVIDEFADLMLQVKDPVESLVMRIAQKARAAGIHLIIGTQRPSTNVITGTIKANIPSRMSCKVASNVDSRTVLDSVGAEKLLNRGDMLFAYAGAIKPLRVQGAFVSDGEVQNIMNHLKQFSTGDNYDESVMEEIKRQAAKCNKKGSDSDDDGDGDESSGEGYLNDRQFLEAVEVAVNSGKISTSLLQRKIFVGYGKAARFIDVMCDMGIVGESNGSKPREVLITADEWREKLARLTYN